MQKVKLIRTVSLNGKMYLRGSEVVLNESELKQLSNFYELKQKPQRVDVKARNTAILRPIQTTEIRQPRLISSLDINIKTKKILIESGVRTVEELNDMSLDDLVKIKGIGVKSAESIKGKVNES